MFTNNKFIHSIKDVRKYYIDNPDINIDTLSIYDSDVMYSQPVFMYIKECASSKMEFQSPERVKFEEAKFNISHISIKRADSYLNSGNTISYNIEIYVKFIAPVDNKIELPEFGKPMFLKDILEWKKSLPKEFSVRIDDANHRMIIEDIMYCFDDCFPDDIDAVSNAIGEFTIEEIHVWTFKILICINIKRSKYLHDIQFY